MMMMLIIIMKVMVMGISGKASGHSKYIEPLLVFHISEAIALLPSTYLFIYLSDRTVSKLKFG